MSRVWVDILLNSHLHVYLGMTYKLAMQWLNWTCWADSFSSLKLLARYNWDMNWIMSIPCIPNVLIRRQGKTSTFLDFFEIFFSTNEGFEYELIYLRFFRVFGQFLEVLDGE